MLEHRLEQALVRAVRDVGGLALKWTSPGTTGVPDRIVFLPNGRIVFVELKAPGKKPTALQAKIHEQLRRLGQTVLVIDSLEEARAFAI
jgi:hypothetical protein